MRKLITPIGGFYIDDALVGDSRIGIVDVEIVENRGPESIYGWPTDQQEAIHAAAQSAGTTAELITPGGWRIPGGKMPAVVAALEAFAATRLPTARRTVV